MHHVVQCLTQLASLTKPVFTTDEEQQRYVGSFVTGILKYISSRFVYCQVTYMYVYVCVCLGVTDSDAQMSYFCTLGLERVIIRRG